MMPLVLLEGCNGHKHTVGSKSALQTATSARVVCSPSDERLGLKTRHFL